MRVRMGSIHNALLYWFLSIGICVPDTCHPHCLSSSLRAHIIYLIVGNQSYFNQAYFCLWGKMAPTGTWVRTGLLCSVCVLCMRNIPVFTDNESCTGTISTKPGSMEAADYRLTRGMCCAVLEVVAVAGLLTISWCVVGAAGFRVLGSFFFPSNAHVLLQV